MTEEHICNFLNHLICPTCYAGLRRNVLRNVSDASRAKKMAKFSYLPDDGMDVRANLVKFRRFPAGVYPSCIYHGAMNCMNILRTLWRCTACGVGAFCHVYNNK